MKQFIKKIGQGIVLLTPSVTLADQPHPWQMGFQEPATPVMEGIHALHNSLLYVIGIIGFLVVAAVLFVIFRFRESRNPIPSKTSHHTLLEIIWTAIPAIIVTVLAVHSLKLLYFMEKSPTPDLVLKVTGHQWYWSYEYPDLKLAFDSYMIEDKDLKPGQLRLLEVDNPIVVPVGAVVKVIMTSADVLHSWAIPSFGIKSDTVPGRLTETWIKVTRPGTYYGQCSELCGMKHGFMPIVVKAVTSAEYEEWLKVAKKQFS
jgi:cytochrome c oxidase subunit 2